MESKGFEHTLPNMTTLHTPPPTQQHASTLPRNFTFQPPRTPEPMDQDAPRLEPPNPPRIRIKRRRPGFPLRAHALASDSSSAADALPSIELSEPSSLPPPLHVSTRFQSELLAPSSSSSLRRFASPPKTPSAQMATSVDDGGHKASEWSHSAWSSNGAKIARPPSTWSEISDSSASSLSSSDTFPSLGDSCTSPESDNADPFVFPEHKPGLLPAMQLRPRLLGKRLREQAKPKWTPAMDDHLWLTYMAYLSDPTVTPFKTLPGTAPPLGVCHRVARHAKRSWRGPRTGLKSLSEEGAGLFTSLDATIMRRETSLPLQASSPETIKPDMTPRSVSSGAFRVPSKWPRSGSSTRKRLRELCKRKSALSPHYQRLMHTRSPSPFESSSSRHRVSSSTLASDSSSFSTRELKLDLSTSTAASMQPDGPLARLTSEDEPSTPQTPAYRSNAHQKSQSLQFSLGLGTPQQPSPELRRLASPFHEQVQVPQLGSRPQAQSPLEIHHPRPLSGSMKRRAQYPLGEELVSDDPDTRLNMLENLFRDGASGKRRVRSRGFSLGAVRHNTGSTTRHISSLFTPPGTNEEQPPSQLASLVSDSGQARTNLAPAASHYDASMRLGSPFAPPAPAGLSNTFPRSLFPQGLDSISSLEQQRHGNSGLDDPFIFSRARPPP